MSASNRSFPSPRPAWSASRSRSAAEPPTSGDGRERRRHERRILAEPSVALVHEHPAPLAPESAPESPRECGPAETSHFFVELHDISDRGACFISDRAFARGTDLDILIHDPATEQWTLRRASAVWSRPHAWPGLFQAGLRFRPTGADDDVRACPWRADAVRPHVADLPFLTSTGLLAAVPRQSLCPLLNCLRARRLAADERLIRQGEQGTAMYFIASGECAVRVDKDGSLFQMARLKPGDVVGEMAVLTGEPRTAHVDALTPLKVWELRRDDFERVSALYPDIRIFLTEIITRRFETSSRTADRAVGKFVIKQPLGQGGWSLVYRGEHQRLHFPVAIKMMRHDLAMDPQFLASFRKEAEIIAPMTHPNIVQVYDVEELYRTVFIVMEHLEGESLEKLLERHGPLPPERVVRFLTQICSGLAYAHARGMVHRDIKPANIFVLEGDRVKILDFGLACPRGTEDVSMAGTLKYASPEQIEGRAVDGRSDLYSLGVMTWELVTGRRPWPEDDLMQLAQRHCEADLPDPAPLAPRLPEGLRRFILRAGACDPAHRQQSAVEAGRELELVAADLGLAAPRPVAGRRLGALFLSHDGSRAAELTRLLEDFSAKAQALGVTVHLTDIPEAEDDEAPPAPPGPASPDVAVLQHPGLVRTGNQDRALVRPLGCGRILLAVADGMGGEAGGDRAADMVLHALEAFEPDPDRDDDHPAADLDRTVRRTSEGILAAGRTDPAVTGMGSTVVAALLTGPPGAARAEWLNLGDSRLYLRRGGALLRITHDHSFLADMVDNGELSEAEAQVHPMRHVLDQCAGTPEAEPDTGRLDLEPDDVLLLCSDGLHALVSDADIAHALAEEDGAAGAAKRLVALALAAGGKDNISVVVARI